MLRLLIENIYPSKFRFVGTLMIVELKDVCEKEISNIRQKDLLDKKGDYPIYGASGLIGNVDFYRQETPYVAVVKDGAGIGRAMLLPAKSSVIGTMQYLIPKGNVLPEYLYYVVKNMHLEKYYSGATIPHIYFKYYKKEKFNLVDLDQQRKIISVFKKIEDAIRKQRDELTNLDTLIKARFVEMFGDPIINNKKLTEVPMTKICQIIDGDRGKNYPRAKDFKTNGYCLFLNAKNVTTTGFDFHKCIFISKERDELLHNGRLNLGDIVLTTRGTIGNLALYTEKVPYNHLRINSGMVILRMNHEKIIDKFFIEQFKMQLKKIKMKIASGSAQPQLPVSTMSKIPIVLPSIRKQEKYSDFVKQVDKSKVVNASIMKYIISIRFYLYFKENKEGAR